jgi:hypothetical protein
MSVERGSKIGWIKMRGSALFTATELQVKGGGVERDRKGAGSSVERAGKSDCADLEVDGDA